MRIIFNVCKAFCNHWVEDALEKQSIVNAASHLCQELLENIKINIKKKTLTFHLEVAAK